MTLNLAALAVFLTALAAGAVLVWRRLPRLAAAGVGEVVCLACGSPGRRLAGRSFECPGCGRDVREVGLAPPSSRAFAGRFWNVVAFTAGLCLAALLAAAFAEKLLPRVVHVSAAESVWPAGEPYRSLELNVTGRRAGRGPGARPLEGELTADLFLKSGELVTLEVFSPSLRYRVVDTAGRELAPPSAPGAFDESAVARWMELAGVDTADPRVLNRVRAVYWRSCEMLGVEPPALAPPPPVISGSLTSSSTGGRSSFGGAPEYALPAGVIGASVLWLAGLWLVLRRGGGEPRSSSARGVPA